MRSNTFRSILCLMYNFDCDNQKGSCSQGDDILKTTELSLKFLWVLKIFVKKSQTILLSIVTAVCQSYAYLQIFLVNMKKVMLKGIGLKQMYPVTIHHLSVLKGLVYLQLFCVCIFNNVIIAIPMSCISPLSDFKIYCSPGRVVCVLQNNQTERCNLG